MNPISVMKGGNLEHDEDSDDSEYEVSRYVLRLDEESSYSGGITAEPRHGLTG